jgi:hypothetical protein
LRRFAVDRFRPADERVHRRRHIVLGVEKLHESANPSVRRVPKSPVRPPQDPTTDRPREKTRFAPAGVSLNAVQAGTRAQQGV